MQGRMERKRASPDGEGLTHWLVASCGAGIRVGCQPIRNDDDRTRSYSPSWETIADPRKTA